MPVPALADDAAADAARPFVKWAGGKRHLVPEIKKILPRTWGRYFEPFVGGGALFWALRPEDAWLSDANDELMRCWSAIRWGVEDVIKSLCRLRWSERDYYRIRAQRPEALTQSQRAARFIYLNKTGYNGLYRVNQLGRCNVPFGRYAKKPLICDAENLRACARVLRTGRVTTSTCSFEKTEWLCKEGDLVYFDPPYVPVSKTASFTAYVESGFGEYQQRMLAQLFTDLTERGVRCILSQSDTPLVRELYADHQIRRVSRPGHINSNGADRGRVREVLVWSDTW